MNIYKTYKPPVTSGGKYLKFEDGESYKLRIVGEPIIFNNEYNGTMSTRYAWVVYNHDLGAPQILQGGINMYKQVANLGQDDDWGDPTQYDIKVRREGTGTDTKYMVSAVPNKGTSLTDEQMNAATAIELKKDIAASPNSHQVMWLSEASDAQANKKDNSISIEDLGKPVDPNEIPF
jgi:hypothetical protein